ncbi:hypothetical protein SLEP1_g40794 [Rubroshorea leprosula]|uniref:Uncharacterized protein n=1 Tax=Rubroshorea leprosula TaxID=152421 RepID=A0AAV5L5E8_9ROSI|nr:hypothetical protein SLEP1_g40794 [Rubroshorea leprosula]
MAEAIITRLSEAVLALVEKTIIPSAPGVAETMPILAAKENESDDISANRDEASDGPFLSINTSPLSIFSENEMDIEANRGNAWDGSGENYREGNESDDISANISAAPDEERLIPNISAVDIEVNTGSAQDGSGQNYGKVPLWEWIFVVSNLIVELPSAVFDQLSSPHKPLYALMVMALSLVALVLCVISLLYKGVNERITFKWPRGRIPWLYYRSQDHKRFGAFADIIGLVCAISQCIVTAINYDFARRAAGSSIKFSLLPTIFALGLLCSRILETVEKKASERQDR